MFPEAFQRLQSSTTKQSNRSADKKKICSALRMVAPAESICCVSRFGGCCRVDLLAKLVRIFVVAVHICIVRGKIDREQTQTDYTDRTTQHTQIHVEQEAPARFSDIQRIASPVLSWSPASPDSPQTRRVGQLTFKDTGEIISIKTYPQVISPHINPLDNKNSSEKTNNASAGEPRDFYLVALAMMRNKAEYVAEWIEFHLLQGFDRFVIYDHMSTDNLHEVLEPYVRVGIVELIVWPLDYDATDLPPLGPRVWLNETHKAHFESVFANECMQIRDTWHIHGGCQRSAMLDAISRYRNRAVWLSIFDVDEFFYVPLSGSESGDISTIKTIRDMLGDLSQRYDHIRVPGKIFSTNGFYNDPAGSVDNRPRLVTEAYRYRMNHENKTRWKEFYAGGRSYSEKAFVRAHLATGTVIHHFTFDGVDPSATYNRAGVRDKSLSSSVIAMNHYQYLSHLGQIKKVLENTNWALDYWRPVDVFLSEKTDYTIGYLVPILQANLYRRGTIQTLSRAPKDIVGHPIKQNPSKTRKHGKIDICIAFTHVEGEAHHLRRAVSTIHEYLRTNEPDITYRTVLVANNRSAPGDPGTPEIVYLRDMLDSFDLVEIIPSYSYWVKAIDRATERCIETGAKYTLFMEDVWETRLQTGSLSDYNRPGLGIPLLRQSMLLMEHEEHILEVWVGDTPIRPREYRHVQDPWKRARFIPEFDKTTSNMRLLQQQIKDKETRNAVWEDNLKKYMKQLGIIRRFGTKGASEYKQRTNQGDVDTDGGSNKSQMDSKNGGLVWSALSRIFGGADSSEEASKETSQESALRRQRAQWKQMHGDNTKENTYASQKSDQDKKDTEFKQPGSSDTTESSDGWVVARSPYEIQSESSEADADSQEDPDFSMLFDAEAKESLRKKELTQKFYSSSAIKLGCVPQTECLSRVTYYRTQGAPDTGLAIVRLGGTLKHNARLKSIGMKWVDAADALPTNASMLAVQETFGRAASAHGFKSAQVCLTAPEFAHDCYINPDHLGDHAVTGIMWRQRLLLNDEAGLLVFPDRPREKARQA